MKLAYLAVASFGCATTFAATPQVLLTSAVRGTEASAEANDASGTPVLDQELDGSSVQGDFISDVSASAIGSLGSSSATARQTSSITPTSITMQAFASGSASAPSLVDGAGASSLGTSTLEVEFTLVSPARLSIDGSLTSNGSGSATPSVTLFDSLGIVWYDAAGNPGTFPFARSDRFDAGTYRFLASFHGSAFATEFFTLDASSFGSFALAIEPLVGTSYCPASPHTQGQSATLEIAGSATLSDNDFTLTARDAIPSTTGLFIGGTGNDQVPLGGGTLCVSQTLFRLGMPVQADTEGLFTWPLDLDSSTAPFAVGATWYFQAWFRDVAAPGGANLSDAVELTWL